MSNPKSSLRDTRTPCTETPGPLLWRRNRRFCCWLRRFAPCRRSAGPARQSIRPPRAPLDPLTRWAAPRYLHALAQCRRGRSMANDDYYLRVSDVYAYGFTKKLAASPSSCVRWRCRRRHCSWIRKTRAVESRKTWRTSARKPRDFLPGWLP